MTGVTYKHLWVESARKQRGDLLTIAGWDLFKDWEQCGVPVVLISNELRMALDVLYADPMDTLGRRFLDRSWAIIERTESEDKFALERDVVLALKQAEFLHAKAMTPAIRDGVTDKERLRQSASNFVAWVFGQSEQPATWDDQDQAYFLAAIASLWICGEVAAASALFDRAKRTRWCRPDALLFRDSCMELVARGRLSEALKVMLWHHFDIIRDPRYKPECFCRLHEFRLEFGAIMWKYVLENHGDIKWNEVVELVSR